MPCVWVEACEGSRGMREAARRSRLPQAAVDPRLKGRSSWLAVAREKAGLAAKDKVSGRMAAR